MVLQAQGKSLQRAIRLKELQYWRIVSYDPRCVASPYSGFTIKQREAIRLNHHAKRCPGMPVAQVPDGNAELQEPSLLG